MNRYLIILSIVLLPLGCSGFRPANDVASTRQEQPEQPSLTQQHPEQGFWPWVKAWPLWAKITGSVVGLLAVGGGGGYGGYRVYKYQQRKGAMDALERTLRNDYGSVSVERPADWDVGPLRAHFQARHGFSGVTDTTVFEEAEDQPIAVYFSGLLAAGADFGKKTWLKTLLRAYYDVTPTIIADQQRGPGNSIYRFVQDKITQWDALPANEREAIFLLLDAFKAYSYEYQVARYWFAGKLVSCFGFLAETLAAFDSQADLVGGDKAIMADHFWHLFEHRNPGFAGFRTAHPSSKNDITELFNDIKNLDVTQDAGDSEKGTLRQLVTLIAEKDNISDKKADLSLLYSLVDGIDVDQKGVLDMVIEAVYGWRIEG